MSDHETVGDDQGPALSLEIETEIELMLRRRRNAAPPVVLDRHALSLLRTCLGLPPRSSRPGREGTVRCA